MNCICTEKSCWIDKRQVYCVQAEVDLVLELVSM